jgi:post-segregation antitoxin (ccd killing protein)
MGRKKINLNDKKIRVSVTINPEIIQIMKDRHINLSSLTNKLLMDYINDVEKM